VALSLEAHWAVITYPDRAHAPVSNSCGDRHPASAICAAPSAGVPSNNFTSNWHTPLHWP